MQRIILSLAVLLLSLHSCVPHVHAAGQGTVFPIHGEGCAFDWLEDMLTLNLGEDHLENFSMAKEELPSVNIVLPIATELPPAIWVARLSGPLTRLKTTGLPVYGKPPLVVHRRLPDSRGSPHQ